MSDAGYVYCIRYPGDGHWKVGKGKGESRAYAGSTHVDIDKDSTVFWYVDDMHTAERIAHAALDAARCRSRKAKRYNPPREWFIGDNVPDIIAAAIGAGARAASGLGSEPVSYAETAVYGTRQEQTPAERSREFHQAYDKCVAAAPAALTLLEAQEAVYNKLSSEGVKPHQSLNEVRALQVDPAQAAVAARVAAKPASNHQWVVWVIAAFILYGIAAAVFAPDDRPPVAQQQVVAPAPVQHHWTAEEIEAAQWQDWIVTIRHRPGETQAAWDARIVQALQAMTPEHLKVILDATQVQNLPREQPRSALLYVVQPGDTFGTIAARFNTTAAEIIRVNADPGGTPDIGQPLVITQPAEQQAENDFDLMQQRAASTCDSADVCESGQCRPHDSEPPGTAAGRSDDGC